ncbi:hypothetical protein FHV99_001647 [Ochrobactrum sp. P20RRXII]|nr:hypothetical protein [Ochrobactrum sp. P20RRXII]NIH74440.1 hypothetical protein [Ochrobactrum sp. P20RRXII]
MVTRKLVTGGVLIVAGISANQFIKGWWQMKRILWLVGALGTVIVAWFIAFTVLKFNELDCLAKPSFCVIETGNWFRKLILLEWASKWQTLLAGICAVAGGAFVLLSTVFQISESRVNQAIEANKVLCHDLYTSFQSLIALGASWQLESEMRKPFLERAIDDLRPVTKCCPQLATEVLIILTHTKITSSYSSVNAAKLQAYSAVIVTIAGIFEKDKGRSVPIAASEVNMRRSIVVDISDQSGIQLDAFESLLAYCTPQP